MDRYQFEIIRNSLEKMLDQGAQKRVISIVQKIHEADIAMLMDYLLPPQRRRLFTLISGHDVEKAAGVISELQKDMAVDLLKGASVEHINKILQEMSADDAAEILSQFPDDLQEKIIESMRTKDSQEIQELLQYPEDTAGRILSPDYLALDENTSVSQAIKIIQKRGDVETIFYVYVINPYGHLLGVISLRQLLLSKPRTLLKNAMNTEVVSVNPYTDQEEVARLVERYNLIAIPVTDEDGKMLGVVTVDDIIDIIREEATEDFLKLAGVSEEDISDRSIFKNVIGRAPWLLVAWMGGVIGSYVISRFENLLKMVIILAAFIPVIAGMGGNVGTQCGILVVRGIALGKIDLKRFWRRIVKEIKIAILLGLLYGALLSFVVNILYDQPIIVALTIGGSLILSIVIAATVGSTIPLLLKKLNVDPAIATGPFVTTSIDVMVSSIYLSIACIILL